MSDILTVAEPATLVAYGPRGINNVSPQDQGPTLSWNQYPPGKAFRVLAVVEAEDSDLFVSHTLSLPGACSQGQSIESALNGLREAVAGCIESYQIHKELIPWQQVDISPLLKSNAAYVGWIDVYV